MTEENKNKNKGRSWKSKGKQAIDSIKFFPDRTTETTVLRTTSFTNDEWASHTTKAILKYSKEEQAMLLDSINSLCITPDAINLPWEELDNSGYHYFTVCPDGSFGKQITRKEALNALYTDPFKHEGHTVYTDPDNNEFWMMKFSKSHDQILEDIDEIDRESVELSFETFHLKDIRRRKFDSDGNVIGGIETQSEKNDETKSENKNDTKTEIKDDTKYENNDVNKNGDEGDKDDDSATSEKNNKIVNYDENDNSDKNFSKSHTQILEDIEKNDDDNTSNRTTFDSNLFNTKNIEDLYEQNLENGSKYENENQNNNNNENGSKSVENDYSKSAENGNFQPVENYGSQSVENDGSKPVEHDGSQPIDNGGSQSEDNNGNKDKNNAKYENNDVNENGAEGDDGDNDDPETDLYGHRINPSDFRLASENGFRWLDPRNEAQKDEFNKLDQIQKKVRVLISIEYEAKTNKFKTLMVYRWMVEYLPLIGQIEQRKFIFQEPSLIAWEGVFKRGTEKRAIIFNIYMLVNYQFVLTPELWAGKGLKYTLFLYYIFLTKRYIVFNERDNVYYQYDLVKWQVRTPIEIMEDVSAFTGSLSVAAVENEITPTADRTTLGKFKSALTIESWPHVMGHNLKNGFLTLKDGRYTLLPHHPNLWQKHVISVDIGSEIIPQVHDKMLRLLCDIAGENVVSLNMVILILNLACVEGGHNLIINLSGNPKGAKSTFLYFIGLMTGTGFKVGKITSTNSFQRENLIINAWTIVFPDSNPKHINPDGIDFLKSLSGRDPIHVEKKHGDIYHLSSYALVIISNNVNFEDVGPYKDSALGDWILNVLVPSITTEATVEKLDFKLMDGLPWMTLFSLTMNPNIIEKTQRSREVNAVTGSGGEKSHIRFILTNCIYLEDAKTPGTELYKTYQTFMKGVDPKIKIESQAGFYQQLDLNLARVAPRGVTRKKTKQGVTYFNILIAKPNATLEKGSRFLFQGSLAMSNLMNTNPLRADAILFKDENGDLVQGPWLDPKINEALFDALQWTKDSNLKELSGLPYHPANPKVKHFEQTGFGGERTIHHLKASEFESTGVFEFQKKLEYGFSSEKLLSETATFRKSELLPYIDEVKSPLAVTKDFYPDRVKIEGIDKSLKQWSAYDLQSKVFVKEIPEGMLAEILEEIKSNTQKGQSEKSALSYSQPAERRLLENKTLKKRDNKTEQSDVQQPTGQPETSKVSEITVGTNHEPTDSAQAASSNRVTEEKSGDDEGLSNKPLDFSDIWKDF